MEAKDTVIKKIALDTFGTNDGIRPKFPKDGGLIQTAMEISFKAGQESTGDYPDQIDQARKAGRKEVVEFTSPLMGKISAIIVDIRGDWTDPRQNCRDAHQLITEWQAKLKEWEL